MSFINAKIIGSNQKRGGAEQPARGSKDFVMSRTELVAFAECPEKWLDGGTVKEETKAMLFGSVLDFLSTSREKFSESFAVAPAQYETKGMQCPVCKTITEAQKCKECKCDRVPVKVLKDWDLKSNTCKKFVADAAAAGKRTVSAEMYGDATLAYAKLHSNADILELINCSEKQVLIVADWQDDNGMVIPFAALLDLVPDVKHETWGKSLADIKTARDGNPAKWARVCDDSGYDVQAAIYFDLYAAARPNDDRTDFVHVVQENTFPFHVVNPPPMLSTEFLDWGRAKYRAALRLYCACLSTGHWPSYQQVGMPFGHTQVIEPKDLWSYRKMAGIPEIQVPEDPYEQQPKNVAEKIDIYAGA